MQRAGRGLRAEQERGADLDPVRAQGQRGRDAARVGDATGRDDRDRHRVDHLRHQRHGAELGVEPVGQEHPAVPAGLDALRDDHVAAVVGQPAGLGHGRRRRHDPCPGRRAPGRPAPAAGSPKWKLTTAGRSCSTSSHARRVERCPAGAGRARPARTPSSAAYGASRSSQCRMRSGSSTGSRWQKKFRLNGPGAGRPDAAPPRPARRRRSSIAHGSEPSPPARPTAMASAEPLEPAIGACTIGSSMPRSSVSLVRQVPVLIRP